MKMYLDAEIDSYGDIDHCPILVRILRFDLVGGLAGGKLVVQQCTQQRDDPMLRMPFLVL